MKLAVFEQALSDFREELADFEPALIRTVDAAALFTVFSALERTIVAAKTLVAGRAAESGQWRAQGHASPASWVAQTTGTGIGQAVAILETSEQLIDLPETSQALRRGQLSGQQLQQIATTATGNRSSEAALLAAAASSGLKGLKQECARVRARSVSERDARQRQEQIHKRRSLQMWIDAEGVGRLEAKLTPEDLARVSGAIKRESNAVFHEARKSGHRESTLAYDADALVGLITGTALTDGAACPTLAPTDAPPTDPALADPAVTGRSTLTEVTPTRRGAKRPPTTMYLHVDLAALRRGQLDDGEVCEIPGVGPVPLATAQMELGEALLKVVISDGIDVTTVVHAGRAVPAHVRTALERRDRECVVPGCNENRRLHIDHYKVRFDQGGPTELWNLCRICPFHHRQKTYWGYELAGGPGRWEWNDPPSDAPRLVASGSPATRAATAASTAAATVTGTAAGPGPPAAGVP
jgi:uncharacterized protein DUF222